MKNDGVIWMSIEDYKKRFSWTTVNYNTDDMHRDHFLMLNDHTKEPGVWEGVCGKKCTLHKIVVESQVAQKVWLTAHTWEDRNLPKKCKEDRDLKHSFGPN